MKLRFACRDCGRKQSMIIWGVCILVDEDVSSHVVIYDNEIRCKSCGSTHMINDHLGLTAAAMRKMIEPDYDEITLL